MTAAPLPGFCFTCESRKATSFFSSGRWPWPRPAPMPLPPLPSPASGRSDCRSCFLGTLCTLRPCIRSSSSSSWPFRVAPSPCRAFRPRPSPCCICSICWAICSIAWAAACLVALLHRLLSFGELLGHLLHLLRLLLLLLHLVELLLQLARFGEVALLLLLFDLLLELVHRLLLFGGGLFELLLQLRQLLLQFLLAGAVELARLQLFLQFVEFLLGLVPIRPPSSPRPSSRPGLC